MADDPVDPKTPDEWQTAVDAAEFYLAIDSCRQYGLLEGGPTVNTDRCAQILERGNSLGFKPKPMRELCERFIGKE